ncbi:MAG: hypothetical protein EBV30_11580 [Actinobacteria bacterium]|nr:hypothetical protein [Actinomycetota bacterium]NBO55305.1 hypothetical protein [Actinomycetota bacterium]
MSQHKHEANGLTFLYGWDRPLGYFFLVIFNRHGHPVWSNMNRFDPAMSIDEIDATMQEYGHRLPETERRKLIGDRLRESGI